MKILKRLFFVILPIFFFSCASMGSGFYEETGLSVTEQLNKGMHETLSEESSYPFLFESEILASESQVKMLWEGLVKAGYSLDAPFVSLNRAVLTEDALLFADSREISVFFDKYIEKKDRIILVEGSDVAFYLLLRKMDKGEYNLLGWKEASK